MKRLIPFDTNPALNQNCFDDYGTGRHHTSSPDEDQRETASPEPRTRQCALPTDPDPRRTAFYAFVSGSEDGLLYVHEAPIEIVPFRDTELVHFSYLSAGESFEEILVTVTEETCFDVSRPYHLIEPNTAVIIVGLDLGIAVEAEIIAGMESEASYRPLLVRYQQSRGWYRHHDDQPRSGGV